MREQFSKVPQCNSAVSEDDSNQMTTVQDKKIERDAKPCSDGLQSARKCRQRPSLHMPSILLFKKKTNGLLGTI